MPEIRTDTYDLDIVLEKMRTFFAAHNVEKVSFEYFDMAETDDWVAKELDIDAMASLLHELYDDDRLTFRFSVGDISFESDGSNFWITYPESQEAAVAAFKGDLN